jgi:hypothetical protein
MYGSGSGDTESKFTKEEAPTLPVLKLETAWQQLFIGQVTVFKANSLLQTFA